mmetsp:Transcript_34496/g.33682  ORF Transcript_34496/g.33682 Transcript_34496/m.33682 type:complete len:323 (+) Transcript_34496:1278-2246(+)
MISFAFTFLLLLLRLSNYFFVEVLFFLLEAVLLDGTSSFPDYLDFLQELHAGDPEQLSVAAVANHSIRSSTLFLIQKPLLPKKRPLPKVEELDDLDVFLGTAETLELGEFAHLLTEEAPQVLVSFFPFQVLHHALIVSRTLESHHLSPSKLPMLHQVDILVQGLFFDDYLPFGAFDQVETHYQLPQLGLGPGHKEGDGGEEVYSFLPVLVLNFGETLVKVSFGHDSEVAVIQSPDPGCPRLICDEGQLPKALPSGELGHLHILRVIIIIALILIFLLLHHHGVHFQGRVQLVADLVLDNNRVRLSYHCALIFVLLQLFLGVR